MSKIPKDMWWDASISPEDKVAIQSVVAKARPYAGKRQAICDLFEKKQIGTGYYKVAYRVNKSIIFKAPHVNNFTPDESYGDYVTSEYGNLSEFLNLQKIKKYPNLSKLFCMPLAYDPQTDLIFYPRLKVYDSINLKHKLQYIKIQSILNKIVPDLHCDNVMIYGNEVKVTDHGMPEERMKHDRFGVPKKKQYIKADLEAKALIG